LLVVFSLLLTTQIVNAQSEETMNVINDLEFRNGNYRLDKPKII
jgi:hypothetical protein